MSVLGSQFFWVTSRAAGVASLVLMSASVGVGVSIGRRLLALRGPDLRIVHEALSLMALGALAIHVLALFGDSYFHPGIADLTIPFVRDYKEPYMAIGIIAGWGTLLLGLSYYLRARIGVSRWRVIHRFTALAWIFAVIHTLGEGSDAGKTWLLVIVAAAVIPPALMLATRIAGRRSAAAAGTA